MPIIDTKEHVKVVVPRITAYGGKPKTIYTALRQARDFLVEEGKDHWTKGEYFTDGDPEDVYENGSLCGNWGCCVMGVIGLVTGESQIAVRKVAETWRDSLDPELTEVEEYVEWVNYNCWYHLAKDGLSGACHALLSEVVEDDVISFNDASKTRREDVIEVINKGLALARKRRV